MKVLMRRCWWWLEWCWTTSALMYAAAPAREGAWRRRVSTAEASLAQVASSVSVRLATELQLLSLLDEARSLPFFSQFSIDMLAGCAYIDEELEECDMDSCEILPIEPTPDALLARDASERTFELDSWARMDVPSADYYDLVAYPEDYTGYNGSHVWRFAYDQLGFGDQTSHGWRAVFDRTVSGVHASVSCHVCDGAEDDESCAREFERRLGSHPDRLANLDFALCLVACAVAEARSWLPGYDFDVGLPEDAQRATTLVQKLLAQEVLADPALREAAAALREDAATATECIINRNVEAEWLEEKGIWQMRQRSRAMLRAMDCVQCGVCRLHGKVCWLGVATALKLIYTHDQAPNKPLARVEVAALLVALEKLASSARFAAEMNEQLAAV